MGALVHNALGPLVLQISNTMLWGVKHQINMFVNIDGRKGIFLFVLKTVILTYHNRLLDKKIFIN